MQQNFFVYMKPIHKNDNFIGAISQTFIELERAESKNIHLGDNFWILKSRLRCLLSTCVWQDMTLLSARTVANVREMIKT